MPNVKAGAPPLLAGPIRPPVACHSFTQLSTKRARGAMKCVPRMGCSTPLPACLLACLPACLPACLLSWYSVILLSFYPVEIIFAGYVTTNK